MTGDTRRSGAATDESEGAESGRPLPTDGTTGDGPALWVMSADSEPGDAEQVDAADADAEWLLDSLAVPLDSQEDRSLRGTDIPDLSDSLAAATQARLPSVDELFDYPVVVNPRVLAWIDAFLGRARKSLGRGLERSGRYLGMARRIFREEGIPQDLAFLAHIESGFRHNARSPARALGLWQFMRGTARLYGLRCDAYVDERLDPEKSTRAAARYLKDLYATYDDWYLALAAYNAGAGKVNRAIQRSGTRDFWQIAQTRYLRNETRNFVPAILAATILAKSPGAYGFPTATEAPLEYDSVPVDSPTDLRVAARCTGSNLQELQTLNPALLIGQTPPQADAYEIRLPRGRGPEFARKIATIPPADRLVVVRHRVRQGETLGLLAHRYRTTVRAIQDANRMGRSTLIRTGHTLLIPSRGVAAGVGAFDWSGKSSVTHEVRRGESLSKIAQHYGSRVSDIQQANGLENPHRICPGQLIEIPIPESVAASRADAAPPGEAGAQATGSAAEPPVRRLVARDCGDSLGRVESTAHIVEEARRCLKEALARGEPLEERAERVHTVRRGDTLGEIAKRYGVRLADLRRWNGLRRGDLIYPGQEIAIVADGEGSAPPRVHRVRRGDTLGKIAERYGVRLSDLRRWNGLDHGHLIYPGQELVLTGGDSEGARVHLVQRGDSLWTIAKRYGVRVRDLANWNRIGSAGTIYPGQKLRVY